MGEVELRHRSNSGIVNQAFDITDEYEMGVTTSTKASEGADQLVSQESSTEGAVSWRTYQRYCKAAGGYIIILITLRNAVVMIGSMAFGNLWHFFTQGHVALDMFSLNNKSFI
ncbi:ATP-binding cassette sub-family C member 5-like [Dunckerocampus dactyliophorus]|uniref:ATP-binding cassette sub-family C member 5-like n=1 Tax=Dunckerocampus dactyliophorus TaxID=161453 RepID=UPI0024077471|nr:ATP-binding cassette sub-family C member 5-like [Dunckerocampus dactyliophorus]